MPLEALTPKNEPKSTHSFHLFSKRKSKRGFTLVELLVVVTIIIALMGIVVGIQSSVARKQNNSKAKAQVQAMATALEGFKAKYGDYPWIQFPINGEGSSENSNKEDSARLLYKALTGGAKIERSGGSVRTVELTGNSRGPVFLDPSKMSVTDGEFFTGEDGFDEGNAYFVDPWGNAYEYFYKRNNATPDPDDEFALWRSKTFVLLSLGADLMQDTGGAISQMYSQGSIMSDPAGYFEQGGDTEQLNSDNIIYNFEY